MDDRGLQPAHPFATHLKTWEARCWGFSLEVGCRFQGMGLGIEGSEWGFKRVDLGLQLLSVGLGSRV